MKKSVLAGLALLAATLIWGSSFFILKNTIDSLPVMWVLAIRFVTSALVLLALFWRKLKGLSRRRVLEGVLTGAFLGGAYITQTYGLELVTPGENAFLTSVYCVVVPFVFWFITKKAPGWYNFVAAVICMTGIGLISLQSGMSFNLGYPLTLVGGLFYSFQMVSIALFSKRHELSEFLTLQFVTAACIMLIGAFIAEPFPTNIGMGQLPSLLYLVFACTLTTMFLQNWGQRHTNPSRAAIIMSLEAVFGVVFSMIFYHEEVSAMTAWGFVAIFVSVLISETGDKWKLPIKRSSAVATERSEEEQI